MLKSVKWTGQYKDRTHQLLNFDWYNDYIPEKILGHYYGNIDCTVPNMEGKIRKFELSTHGHTET